MGENIFCGVWATMKKEKSGIAFGGGGTRGIAHLGMIRVFQENGVEFDYVAGNSAGAIAGALYAADIPWEQLYDFVLSIKDRNVLPKRPALLTYMSPEIIERLADCFLKDKRFKDLNRPFCAVAVDLEQGTLETLCSGSVSKALSASCAVPGVFSPVCIGEKTYIDGGTLCSIPTQELRDMGAEKVVGINLNSDRSRGTSSVRRIDVFLTAYNLSININSQLCEKCADLMLKPKLDSFARHSLKSVEDMLKIGEEEARSHIEEIKELLN
jgi:NTE family protein